MENVLLPFPQKAILVLIDVQKGFDNPVWGRRNNPDAEMTSPRVCDHRDNC